MEGKSILIFGENHDEYYTENDYEKLQNRTKIQMGILGFVSVLSLLALFKIMKK